MDGVRLTKEEKTALDALVKLNQIWPSTLKLQFLPPTLAVFKTTDGKTSFIQVASMPNKMGKPA